MKEKSYLADLYNEKRGIDSSEIISGCIHTVAFPADWERTPTDANPCKIPLTPLTWISTWISGAADELSVTERRAHSNHMSIVWYWNSYCGLASRRLMKTATKTWFIKNWPDGERNNDREGVRQLYMCYFSVGDISSRWTAIFVRTVSPQHPFYLLFLSKVSYFHLVILDWVSCFPRPRIGVENGVYNPACWHFTWKNHRRRGWNWEHQIILTSKKAKIESARHFIFYCWNSVSNPRLHHSPLSKSYLQVYPNSLILLAKSVTSMDEHVKPRKSIA